MREKSPEIKHTPGPWHVGMKPGPIVYGPKGEQVSPLNIMLDPEEAKANARLIAAAPELLDALKSVLPYLGEEVSSSVMRKVHDALSKAEGREV